MTPPDQNRRDRPPAGPAEARQGAGVSGNADDTWLKMLDWDALIELMHQLHDALTGDVVAQASLQSLARMAAQTDLDLRMPMGNDMGRLEALRVIVQRAIRERIAADPDST